MYKRKIESLLLEWKSQPKRKPLIIKGVRQCGKIDENHHLIIEKFCEAEHNMTQVLPPPYYSVMLERK